jgi:S1-C subfamily serine protease
VSGQSGFGVEIRTGPRAGSTVEVGRRLVIGSDPSCDISLDDPEVAEEHASVRVHDGALEIRDLGSESGTFVNARRIAAPTPLADGDEVRVGSTVLVPAQVGAAGPAAAGAGAGAAAGPATGAAAGTGVGAAAGVGAAGASAAGGATGSAPSAKAGGSGGNRRLLIAGGVLALIAVAVVVVILVSGSGGSSGPLTSAEIIETDKPSTLMVVGRGVGASPITGGTNKILDSGTAWVYDAEKGLIVTNAHVVLNASAFEAGYDSSSLRRADLVAVDARDDLAMLKVNSAELKTLPMADEEELEQGETVYALGYPGNGSSEENFLSSPFQATEGTLSTLEDEATVSYDAFEQEENENAGLLLKHLYQTTAAINPGNSGGPLVNDQGELVGVNVARGGGESQNDAISVTTVRKEVPKLAKGESTAWLGLGLNALATPLAGCPQSEDETGFCIQSESEDSEGNKYNNESLTGGMLVGAVARDTPVDQQTELSQVVSKSVGNEYFVLVTSINGTPVTNQQQYVNLASGIESGQQVEMCHIDVTLNPKVSNVGPYCEKFNAP